MCARSFYEDGLKDHAEDAVENDQEDQHTIHDKVNPNIRLVFLVKLFPLSEHDTVIFPLR
jgi:hypothetical protein